MFRWDICQQRNFVRRPLSQCKRARRAEFNQLLLKLFGFFDCCCTRENVIHIDVTAKDDCSSRISLLFVGGKLAEGAHGQEWSTSKSVSDRIQLVLDEVILAVISSNYPLKITIFMYHNLREHLFNVRRENEAM